MIEGIPRISVLIICYNQEKVIARTIDSLLAQKDYIYEICVSDDCSKDRTWDILQEYDKKYPGLFKLNRNNPNIGIFENIEKTWEMPTGDIISRVSGDDKCGEGWFKHVVEFIQEKNIDYKKELFCIYGDHVVLYGNGDSRRARNRAIAKSPNDALRLALRSMISNRGCCFSINVLKMFDKVSQGRSYYVELAQDRLLQMYAEKNYYIPEISNIYYARIGVSTHIEEDTFKQVRPYMEECLHRKGIEIKKKDLYFNKYIMAKGEFRKYHRVNALIRSIWYKIKSIDLSMPYNTEATRQLVFAVRRRFPHKKPIHFD